jgi:hypothetical protein
MARPIIVAPVPLSTAAEQRSGRRRQTLLGVVFTAFPTFLSDDITGLSRLHISRQNAFVFNPGASAVLALLCSARSATANRPNREFATGPHWASKRGNNPLKNPSKTVVESRPRMVMEWASENGRPTRDLEPQPDRKSGKIATPKFTIEADQC